MRPTIITALLLVLLGGACRITPEAAGAPLVTGIELSAPSWSADGKWIAVDSEQPPGVIVVATEGNEKRRLTEGAYHNEPCWAPSTDSIVYVDKEAGGLWLLEGVLGSAPRARELVAGYVDLYPGCWSPSGEEILFVDRKGLGVVNRAAEARYLVEKAENETLAFPRWSFNGKHILVSRYPEILKVATQGGVVSKIPGIEGALPLPGPREDVWLRAARKSSVLLLRRASGEIAEIELGGAIRAMDVMGRTGKVLISVERKGIAVVDPVTLGACWISDRNLVGVVSWSPEGDRAAIARVAPGGGKGELWVTEARCSDAGVE